MLLRVAETMAAQGEASKARETTASASAIASAIGDQQLADACTQVDREPADVQAQFARLLNDTSKRRIELLTLHLAYQDQDGRPAGSDVVNMNPNVYSEAIALPSFGKGGAPRSVTVSLSNAIWSSPAEAAVVKDEK